MKVIDMHCDTIKAIFDSAKGQNPQFLSQNKLHIDISKMRTGNYLLQNFAMFVPLSEVDNPFENCMDMIDCYYTELEKNSDFISPIFTYKDIEENQLAGKISAMLTIEEGGVTKNNLCNLRNFYRLGVRMITLTWNFENGVGYPNFIWEEGKTPNFQSFNTQQGLTSYGIDMVKEMERLGIIIDVSHLSDGGFYDVLKHTTKPFVASHSNARTICNHCRNLNDDMIKALADRGGVTGLNFCGSFLTNCGPNDDPKGMIDDMVRHITHISNIGGIECIGLGSDFDGISDNLEIKNASFMPLLADALKKNGFCSSEIESVFYKNVLRVYRDIL